MGNPKEGLIIKLGPKKRKEKEENFLIIGKGGTFLEGIGLEGGLIKLRVKGGKLGKLILGAGGKGTQSLLKFRKVRNLEKLT